MNDFYVMNEKREIIKADLMTWALWFEDVEKSSVRLIAKETHEGVEVSTVFLGINHQFGDGPPLIFETMIFGGPHDGEGCRCSTLEQAEAQHRRIVRAIRGDVS